jgi:hypothetical protein
MNKRQAKKILFERVFGRRWYRGSTIARMRKTMRQTSRRARRDAQKRITALSPEQRRHFSLIRIPVA